jgi:hypothetical protein
LSFRKESVNVLVSNTVLRGFLAKVVVFFNIVVEFSTVFEEIGESSE